MKKIILYIPILILILASCEEKIELDLDEDYTRLVVEGSVTDNEVQQTIYLSTTASYFSDEQTPRVSGANVTVSEGSNVYDFTEAMPGKYVSTDYFAGEQGKEYTLRIELKEELGGESVFTATEKMPVKLQLDSIAAAPLPVEVNGRDVQVLGYGQEPPMEGNYYMWDLYVNGVLLSDTLDKKTFTDDEMVNGSYIPGLPIYYYDGSPNDTIEIRTQSITEQYYGFLLAFIQEAAFGGNNFSGPPANVQGNISGGALGYFSVKSVTSNQTIYHKP